MDKHIQLRPQRGGGASLKIPQKEDSQIFRDEPYEYEKDNYVEDDDQSEGYISDRERQRREIKIECERSFQRELADALEIEKQDEEVDIGDELDETDDDLIYLIKRSRRWGII